VSRFFKQCANCACAWQFWYVSINGRTGLQGVFLL